jgi:hypothetical protein
MKKTTTEKQLGKLELSDALRRFLPPTDDLTLGVPTYWYVHLRSDTPPDRKSEALPATKHR